MLKSVKEFSDLCVRTELHKELREVPFIHHVVRCLLFQKRFSGEGDYNVIYFMKEFVRFSVLTGSVILKLKAN